jgi:hypothetical protein
MVFHLAENSDRKSVDWSVLQKAEKKVVRWEEK